jgi:hypothetical protein
MTTIRMLPRGGGTVTAWIGPNDNVAGRTYYTAAANGTVDVACDASAASNLASQGLIQFGDSSGATSTRPSYENQRPGWVHVDTTLNLIVMWNGAGWVNPVTGAAA